MNINSLKNKLYDLEFFISTLLCKPDIILLTEIRINEYEHKFYNIANYESKFSSRKPNKKKKSGGGVGCFVLKDLKFNVIYDKSDDYDNFLFINLIDHNLNIGIVYSPPDANKNEMFNNLEQMLTLDRSIIFGDFNINLLDNNSNSVQYMDLILANNYFIVNEVSNKFATRISHNNSRSIIDHAISNIEDLTCNFILNDSDLSDHKYVWCNLMSLKNYLLLILRLFRII